MVLIFRGCVTALAILLILGVLTFAGCTAIIRPFTDWRESANAAKVAEQQAIAAKAVAKEQTTQTAIEWDGRVDIAKIQTNGEVQIARIEADRDKKTSWQFSIFYLIRGLAWIVGVAMAAVGAYFLRSSIVPQS